MSRHPGQKITPRKVEIFAAFAANPTKIFTVNDLKMIMASNRGPWQIPRKMSIDQFIDLLSSEGQLNREILKSQKYGNRIQYCWGNISDYELALSAAPGACVSHLSAAYLHGLSKKDPSITTVNREQSPKPSPDLELTQSSIDRAFGGRPRISNMVFKFRKRTVRVVSGKNTGNLGVEQLRLNNGIAVPVTGLERTLIDMLVRPEYAGGPGKVLSAFRKARNRVSAELLADILERLDYIYPFHQAIGFYMELAGYVKESLQLFRKKEFRFDFYLMHGMSDTEYDSEWRLHFPKGLKRAPYRPQTAVLGRNSQ